jgi:UDP-3-O-[3-hydroxymyristoyl] glucosamine N-acyltransferase
MRLSQITDQFKEKFEISEVVQDRDFSTLALATSEIDMDFCTFIDEPKYVDQIRPNASMVITTPEIASLIHGKGLCISQSPRISFFKLHNHLVESQEYMLAKNFKTEIGHGCRISNMAYIAEQNVSIGNNVTIEEFVSIKENTIIGDNTFIGAGTVVGGEGYEFKRLPNGEVLSVKHAGWTKIGSNVEIQYNVCIDKAIYPWDATIINDFCKIDNLVHIAHGVKLGKAVFLVAGSLIGGRTIIKDRTWIGVGATVSNGLVVGEEARVNIGAVATLNVDDGSAVTGNFAIEHKKFIQFIKSIG